MNIKIQDEIETECKRQRLPLYYMLIFHICKRFNNYIKFLTCMCNKEDYNGYYDYIIFSENIYDEEENIQSLNNHKVCFGFHEDVDIVDCMEVYKYLEISTNIYLKYYPEKKQEVLTILEKIQEKYLSKY